MRVELERPVADFVRGLPPEPKRRVRSALRALGTDWTGRQRGLDVKQLDLPVGEEPLYRLAVGPLRFAFLVEGRTLRIVRGFPRTEGYGWLARLREMGRP
jgi:hypothetical protein